MIIRPTSRSVLIALMIAVAIVFANEASATSVGFDPMLRQVSKQAAQSTPFVAVLSYVAGVFFAAAGLFKLKDWINEGDKAGIKPAIFRLALSALLIVLPHTLRVMAGTWFGRGDGKANVNVEVPMPNLGAFAKQK